MKKFLLLAVVMSVCLTASAQQPERTWSLTPKVGFNLANLAGDINGTSMKFGLTFGADVMYQVSPTIGISGGLFFSRQGAEGEGKTSYGISMINIPILANFYVYKGLALKTGLQPGFIASASTKNGDTTTSTTDQCQTIDIAIPFGISYEFSSFVFDARYNLGLSKVYKGNGSIRNSVFQITVGYKIPF